MSRIKTRESVKDIKVIDKAAVASERMKTALVRSKDQFENLMDDGQVTPSEYAEDKIRYAAEDVADRVGHEVSSETKKAVNKGKEAYRKHREEKRIEKIEERVNRYEEQFRREEQARTARTSSQESHSHQSATRASEEPIDDIGIVYGKWITGGIGISIDSFDRVSKIMSWLPKDTLRKSALLAGFDIPELDADSNTKEDSVDQEKEAEESLPPADKDSYTNEAFHLIGRPELEQFFTDNIIDIVLHQEQYKRMGISFPGATILYGPPGCGKT